MESSHPPMMWAQDRHHVFITIKLQDVFDEIFEFHETDFVFKGKTKSLSESYDMPFHLFGEIDPEHKDTKYNVYGRNIQISLHKKNPKVWWPRLAKTTQKLHNIKIDWERWVDDDEDDYSEEKPIKATKKIETSSSDSSSDSEENKEKIEEVKTEEEEEVKKDDADTVNIEKEVNKVEIVGNEDVNTTSAGQEAESSTQ